MEVTNNSKAPQGIHTLTGVVFVQPGETKTVRLNKTLESHAKGLDFFELDGEAEDDELDAADEGQGVRVPAEQMEQLRTKFEEQEAEIGRLTSENADLTTTISERDETIEGLQAQIVELNAALEAAAQPKDDGTTPEFTVTETSPGWFAVLDNDGKQVGNKMREDDAKAFEAMSPEEQKQLLAE